MGRSEAATAKERVALIRSATIALLTSGDDRLATSALASLVLEMLAEGRGASLLLSRTVHLVALALGAFFARGSSDPIRFLAIWTSAGHGLAILSAWWAFRGDRSTGQPAVEPQAADDSQRSLAA